MKIQYPSYPDLRDRTVLITGGGSGIGAAFVEAFVLQGSRVAFLDIQNEVSQELVQSLSGKGPEPIYVECDVTDISALKDAIQQVEEELGVVRVLINNAANDERHSPEEVTPEYWEIDCRSISTITFLRHRPSNPRWQRQGEVQLSI